MTYFDETLLFLAKYEDIENLQGYAGIDPLLQSGVDGRTALEQSVSDEFYKDKIKALIHQTKQARGRDSLMNISFKAVYADNKQAALALINVLSDIDQLSSDGETVLQIASQQTRAYKCGNSPVI